MKGLRPTAKTTKFEGHWKTDLTYEGIETARPGLIVVLVDFLGKLT